jgi:hypothetical protein
VLSSPENLDILDKLTVTPAASDIDAADQLANDVVSQQGQHNENQEKGKEEKENKEANLKEKTEL